MTNVTSHVPISEVSKLVTKERVKQIIKFAHDTVTQAGGTPKIAVVGLNLHAGDGGLMGCEEIDEIAPAVKEAQEEGYNVEGPFPTATIYLRIQEFNSLVGMYHDQAQIGMKLVGFIVVQRFLEDSRLF